jgi:UDP-N-acetylmuramoylalanine--D-glutamate ligase
MSTQEKIAIAGFGMEGKATYEYLKGSGEVHIFDELPKDMEGINAAFHQTLTIPADFKIVYKTPGIPTHKLVLESPDTKIETLMDLVLRKVGQRSVGVTGTKGKSTTTALIQHILKSAGKDAILFGNIGVADMHLLEKDSPERIYVIELSSYQCEHLSTSPHVAVFTSFFQDHLVHHESLENYRGAKLNLFAHQNADDFYINGSTLQIKSAGQEIKPDFAANFETKLLGEHNQRNCALAAAAAALFGVSEEEAKRAIATFEPLPYRLENVGTFGEITFYDDALSTIPEALLAAIYSLPRVDTVILGGEDRGISFDNLAEELAKTSVRNFLIFPTTGKKMVTKVRDRTVREVRSMEEAVKAAFEVTPKNGTVLLSTASPSFNMFKDYKDRSVQYREWIKKLA